MSDIANLAQSAIQAMQEHGAADQSGLEPGTRRVLMLLYSAYGNQFTAKYGTGQKDANCKDLGLRAAMLVWQENLRRFSPDVVEEGVRRCIEANPQFPPSFPQVEAHCLAAMPRKPTMPSEPRQALPPPDVRPVDFTPKGDRLDWARRILAREAAGHRLGGATVKMVCEARGGKWRLAVRVDPT